MNKIKLASYSLTLALASSILSNNALAQIKVNNGLELQQQQTAHVNNNELLNAKVVRTEEGKLNLSWDGSLKKDKIRIFWSTSPDKIGKLLVKVNLGTSITIDDPSANTRPYFHLIGENGIHTVVAERKISLQGTFNFRDLGGYETVDGKTVKWGKLYRSDALGGLTKQDISYLQNSGIKTILDYRSADEIAKSPDPVIPGVKNINDPVIKSGNTSLDIFNLDMAGLDKTFQQMQREMVEDPDVDAYRTLFQLLLNSKNEAVLQHCTAGKDRTGVGSALVLLALGVPENTVLDDYLLSNNQAYIEKQLATLEPLLKTDEQRHVVTAIFGVKKEWLQASLNQIKEHYGSYDNYFKKVIGLTAKDRQKLKDLYLN
ncbi:tyrosine-protein phosphatase [Gottfriedia acidiceleris]|uniref:tyrosine-protein phosphatase n=1 Tax=Gottfriedia acidiceleris TaxID=371036 RepID=UPI002FFE4CE8